MCSLLIDRVGVTLRVTAVLPDTPVLERSRERERDSVVVGVRLASSRDMDIVTEVDGLIVGPSLDGDLVFDTAGPRCTVIDRSDCALVVPNVLENDSVLDTCEDGVIVMLVSLADNVSLLLRSGDADLDREGEMRLIDGVEDSVGDDDLVRPSSLMEGEALGSCDNVPGVIEYSLVVLGLGEALFLDKD